MTPIPISTGLAVVLLVAASGDAGAISRYSATSMSCENIRATVRAEGAAIFKWKQPPNIDRFDRLVAHSGFCLAGEVATATDIPAKDTGRCVVFDCQRPVFDDDFFWRWRFR